MNYIQRTKQDIKENFVKNLLFDRDILIEDEKQNRVYFNPTIENEIEPCLLDNMEEGYQLLMKHLKNHSKIYLVVDADTDGYVSSALFYNYLMEYYSEYSPNIEYHIPDGKQHGLESLMKDLTREKKYDLIVCPDSSSNDYEEHEILSNMKYDILILDHHNCPEYSKNAVTINNQLSEKYKNKDLSGVGVVYKFFEYCEQKENRPHSSLNFLDLVMLGEISDMMNMGTIENRFIYEYGRKHINNMAIKGFIKEQCYSLFGISKKEWSDEYYKSDKIDQLGIAFYITPLINALIRVGTQIDKTTLFKALIKEIDYSVYDSEEDFIERTIKNCVSAKNKQNNLKTKATNLLDIQIANHGMENDKVLILSADELDVPTSITGLCAMNVAAKYNKPTMLGRTNGACELKGSIRGRENSELKDFQNFLLNSKCMEYVQGHKNAAGFGIKLSNINKLKRYIEKELKDIDFNNNCYEVDFVLSYKNTNISSLVCDVYENHNLFGQSNPEPIILVKDIPISYHDFCIMGKNQDTIKFIYKDITYIKFHAKDLIKKINSIKGNITVTVLGKSHMNEWKGQLTPQIFIDDIEIKKGSIYDF